MADTLLAETIPYALWCNLCSGAVAAILMLVWVALILEQMVRGLKHCDTDVHAQRHNIE